MGAYVYTARATGRLPVWINGGIEWVFPMKFAYKPNWYNHEATERWERQADRQSEKVVQHPDWSGYVEMYGGLVYRTDSGYFNDGGNDFPGYFVGQIFKVGKERFVR